MQTVIQWGMVTKFIFCPEKNYSTNRFSQNAIQFKYLFRRLTTPKSLQVERNVEYHGKKWIHQKLKSNSKPDRSSGIHLTEPQ